MSTRLLLVITFVASLLQATAASASCTCSCLDGQIRPACTNSFDVPPICPATTCTRSGSSPIGPPPLAGSRSTCRDKQVCDAFQRCTWKTICKGDIK